MTAMDPLVAPVVKEASAEMTATDLPVVLAVREASAEMIATAHRDVLVAVLVSFHVREAKVA